MRKFITVVALMLGLAVGWWAVEAQTQTWFVVQNERGLHITAGTVFPSATSELGWNPADGMLHIDLNQATANPALYIYSAFTTAWIPVSPISGAGMVPSTLATNAVDVVNSIWGGTNQLIFEGGTADAGELAIQWTNSATDVTITIPADNADWAGTGSFMITTLATNAPEAANSVTGGTNQLIFEGATANAFEIILQPADTTGDVTLTLPSDNADWAGTGAPVVSTVVANAPEIATAIWGTANAVTFEGATANGFELDLEAADVGQDQDVYIGDYGEADVSVLISLIDDMDVDEANAVWVAATGVNYEGATADGFEVQIGAVDPIRDGAINFNNAAGDYIVTTRDGGGGYYGGIGVPNPWRQSFIADGVANATGLLDDHSAVMGAADTNVNNVVMGTSSMEFWVELAAAGGVAALLTPNADGWLVESDDTVNEGIQGMFFGADDDFDVGWGCTAQTDACYLEVNFSVTDSSETDQVLFGFLVRENYSADAEEDGYNTYCLVGIDDAVADPRDIVVSEEVNADGGANTDTTVDIVDGTNIALRVELEADGTCDIWVNGVETNANVGANPFDAADFAVPYFSILNSAGDGTPDPDVIIRYVEVGYLN